jgi:hypothetical protein
MAFSGETNPGSREENRQRPGARSGCIRAGIENDNPIYGDDMTIHWAFSIGNAAIGAAIALGSAGPALAQACTHDGPVVMCNDGRRGLLSGDAIVWPDGTRSSLTPHPSVIVGNKASVIVGQGVFVGQGKGVVPLDNPSAPNKMRCATLDGASYCN